MIGRGPYIEVLRQACQQARLGQGQTIMLAGEAGVGKSRLVAEVSAIGLEAGFSVLQADCFESGDALPYAPLLDLLRGLLANPGSDSPTAALTPFASDLTQLLPELASLWPDAPPAAPMEPQRAQQRHFQAVAQFLARRKSPLVLIIEDLHWADESTLEFLLYFASRVVGQPILLLLTYRSDEPNPVFQLFAAKLERARLAAELTLARLPAAKVELMIRAIFGQGWPVRAEFAESIYSLTGGNPFFVEETLKALVTAGDIYETDGAWTRKPLAELQIPRSVQDAVQRRFVRLSEPARQLLTLAAVAGCRFDVTFLQVLSQINEDELVRCLRELVAAQLATEAGGDYFVFRHSLTQQAIYSGLLVRERQSLHHRLFDALEQLPAEAGGPASRQAELAEHAFQAGLWDRALTYSRRAGERALALYAPRAAVEHFTRALEAARRVFHAAPASLYHVRGQAYEWLGEFESARLDYEQEANAAHLAHDPRAEWQSLIDLGFLWQGRDDERAGGYFQRAFGQAYTFNDPVVLSLSLNRIGNWYANNKQPTEALAFHHQALELSKSIDDQHSLASTLDLLGAASYLSGDLVAGTDYFRQAIALFRSLEDKQGLAASLVHIALGATLDTETPSVSLVESIWYGEEALAITRENGWRAEQAHVLSELGIGYGRKGEYRRALELAQAGLDLATAIEHQAWISYAHAALGFVHLDLFALSEARAHLEQAQSIAQAVGSQHLACFAAHYAASAMLQSGAKAADIEAVLGLAIEVRPAPAAERTDASWPSLAERSIACARAEVALANGDPALALETVTRLMAPAGAADDHPSDEAARAGSITLLRLAGEAQAALRQPVPAEATLRQAQRAAVDQGALPALWRVHAALGKLYLRLKQRTKANTEFQQARAIVQGLAEQVPAGDLREQFLRGTQYLAPAPPPPTPRRAAQHEPGRLTERERETVALIAEGKTNREIAARLVVSEETVKSHVSHILTKLGLSSRTQIAAWAVQIGLTPKT